MNCYICSHQSFQLAGNGFCDECNQSVCTRPPQRRDKVFHGERCRCGCSKLVCEIDLAQHAAKHGGTATGCFPTLCLAQGIAALGASRPPDLTSMGENSLVEQRQVLALNRFLNCVTPGHAALRQAARSDWFTRERTTGVGDLRVVYFTADFYTVPLRARVAALATDVVRRAATELPTERLLRTLSPLTQLHLSHLLLRNRSFPMTGDVDEWEAPERDDSWFRAAVEPWAGNFSSDISGSGEGFSPNVSDAVARDDFMRHADANAIAAWVLGGRFYEIEGGGGFEPV